ncbi:universal stress protein [Streptomyces glomeratus]|uniref:Universal stress protein n=1 Tax=Streptomyces glomeratus TaxID=284452 RepID=A0ABP6LCB1_9ACTN|nr:universal stress protein [Streptomyces glomeratus]MCF1508805.1 universal stress protein [Streptomyces glomeratus]
MPRPVTVGLDSSSESRAAAEWAAREARLRGLPLTLVHVREPVPDVLMRAPLLGTETRQDWIARIPREAAEGLRLRHPGVEVTAEHRAGRPADVLAEVAEDAELLVLGSRALGGVGGFLLGSVSLAVVARAVRPVILVRTGEQAADEHEKDPVGIPSAATRFRPVVLGLDTEHPSDEPLRFAFEEAAYRAAPLHLVHGWNLPFTPVAGMAAEVDPYDEYARERAGALSQVLGVWRQKYPAVEVVERSRSGSAAALLVEASREASLVVVGRRIHRNPLGVRIGSVTHAVLHHASAPVAVVAHD